MIQSEEKSFKQYIKDKALIQVIFNLNAKPVYTILDENLDVVFEHILHQQEQFHKGKKGYLNFPVPFYKEFGVEPNSEEFEKFKRNCIDVSLNSLNGFVNETT